MGNSSEINRITTGNLLKINVKVFGFSKKPLKYVQVLSAIVGLSSMSFILLSSTGLIAVTIPIAMVEAIHVLSLFICHISTILIAHIHIRKKLVYNNAIRTMISDLNSNSTKIIRHYDQQVQNMEQECSALKGNYNLLNIKLLEAKTRSRVIQSEKEALQKALDKFENKVPLEDYKGKCQELADLKKNSEEQVQNMEQECSLLKGNYNLLNTKLLEANNRSRVIQSEKEALQKALDGLESRVPLENYKGKCQELVHTTEKLNNINLAFGKLIKIVDENNNLQNLRLNRILEDTNESCDKTLENNVLKVKHYFLTQYSDLIVKNGKDGFESLSKKLENIYKQHCEEHDLIQKKIDNINRQLPQYDELVKECRGEILPEDIRNVSRKELENGYLQALVPIVEQTIKSNAVCFNKIKRNFKKVQ